MKSLTPHLDSTQIYVSTSGQDTNTGTKEHPLQTINKAIDLTDNNSPTWIRLRNGDTFQETIRLTKGGKSPEAPFVISDYGEETPNKSYPQINSGDGTAIRGDNVSYVAIQNVRLYAHTRNPKEQNYKLSQGGHGIYWLGDTWNWLVLENLDISYFRNGITIQNRNQKGQSKDVIVRSCNVRSNHSHDGHSQGMFTHGINGLLLYQNEFFHNGWYENRDTGGVTKAKATKFNHNVYIDNERSSNISVISNKFSNAASHGIQLRPGGTLLNNVFSRNPIQAQIGGGSNYQKHNPDGVHAVVTGNQAYHANDINSEAVRGIGFLFENIRSAICSENEIAYDESISSVNTRAIRIGADCHTENMTFTNNLVYGHIRGGITAKDGQRYESHGNSWYDTQVDEDNTLTKDIIDFHHKLTHQRT